MHRTSDHAQPTEGPRTRWLNARPQRLRNAHAALNRVFWGAYSWDDPDPASVDEDTILPQLLALNLERTHTGLAAYKELNVWHMRADR